MLYQPLSSNHYEEAAELIRDKGWIQGKFGNDDTGYCLVGALSQVTALPVQTVLCHTDVFTLFDGLPMSWNDTPGRTQEQVEDALMSAAKKLRNEGR